MGTIYNLQNFLFVETPRKFITAKLSTRKLHQCSDSGLRFESFAEINWHTSHTPNTEYVIAINFNFLTIFNFHLLFKKKYIY
jgi:hypothetical protein